MNEYQEWLSDITETQRNNYELCMKYPVLIPHDAFTGEVIPSYEYEFTRLDQIPEGWRKAFGEEWAAELQEAVNKLPDEVRDKFYIQDLKEKYGFFDQFFSFRTDEIREVERKYEILSQKTCIKCGAPATKISQGWISPWCDTCAAKIVKYERFVDIDEYNEDDGEDEDDAR